VAGLERKNGWTLAERAGEVSPDGMQRLLRWADWDVGGVRDDVRGYVAEHLGEPDGVLIADETGSLKRGTRSAGVQRQYSGTAGRTENCQIGVFLAYASSRGHALIDRELYLPQSWTEDRQRCRAAGIPDEVEFTTKPRQAQAMIARAIAAGVPFRWFTADDLRAGQVPAGLAGRSGRVPRGGHPVQRPAGHHLRGLLARRCADRSPARERLAAAVSGSGSPWPARIRLGSHPPAVSRRGHWLMARRSLNDPDEIAYYIGYGPRRSTLVDLAWIAGSRWHIEECIQQAKGETGLDHYQVRSWRAWYAHITLSMLALAWLSASRAQVTRGEPAPATRA
jgi:SRSO17 transposase